MQVTDLVIWISWFVCQVWCHIIIRSKHDVYLYLVSDSDPLDNDFASNTSVPEVALQDGIEYRQKGTAIQLVCILFKSFVSFFFIQVWNANKLNKFLIQINVIYLRESGSQTPQDQLIQMRAVLLLNLLKIVWRMGDLIQVICIGDGSHMVAMFLFLMQRNFWMSCEINLGHWLVILFSATMSSRWFAFLLRCSSDFSAEFCCFWC